MAISGDVKSLTEAINGNVLAGTNNSARIYRSTDNGQTWSQVAIFGSGSDSVNTLITIRSDGVILAAVTGSAGAQGIWRSTDNGTSWTRVKQHPSGSGYRDIANRQTGGRVVAVGNATAINESPVIISINSGLTWQNIDASYYRNFMAVASQNEVVLDTVWTGGNIVHPQWLMGVDSYYTEQWGVGYTGLTPSGYAAVGFSTEGGGAGNGGLDMVAFLFKNAVQDYKLKGLWAVKSHLNVADTEIWGWPKLPIIPNANQKWAKLTTLTGVIFNAMYVDPVFTNWQSIGAERTIWAGANGTIYVSYNSGLTWSIATTAPTGQIYSFVRTTTGILIAGGAAGEIFLFGGTGGEGGGPGEEEPGEEEPPPVVDPGEATSRILGRSATCDEEIFVANKFSYSNITHLFHYNGVNYTNLQFGTEPPYSFLGTTAVTNKAAYFGSKTNDTNVPGGSFSSLIFDITQKSENITVVWEYWNGSAWTTLTVQDNTDQFKREGVNSVNWLIPSNWATTTVNSVVGYWVRARISAVAASPVVPIHDNRYIYTTLLPYVHIDEGQIKGDLPAIGKVTWRNKSVVVSERMIIGLKSYDKGPSFNAYTNISDVDAPFGITVTAGTDAGVAWQDDNDAPTNRSLLASYSSAGDLNTWNDLATITLSNTIARDFYGHYRAFIRCFYNNASAQAWNLRLQIRFGSGGNKSTSQTAFPSTLCDWEAVDLGPIAIPTTQAAYQTGLLSDQLTLAIQGYCTAVSKPLTLYDLVLIPVDEWAVDAIVPELVSTGTPQIINNNYLDVDSITNPKISISAMNRNAAGHVVSRYQTINNGPVILQKNTNQRLWFMSMSWEAYWRSFPDVIGSVQVFKQQQYLGFRGRN